MKKIILNLIIALFWISYSQGQNYTQSSGTVTKAGQAYSSTTNDLSGVKLTGGTFNLSSSSVTTSGASTSTDSSSFYGLNAGVLAYNGSSIINLTSTKVTTSGSGANGVFAYGTGTVNMTSDTVYCTGSCAHGIMCAGGGTMTATDVVATTTLNNGAVIATDRGTGNKITVTRGKFSSGGQDSPGVYSTGVITVSDAAITSATECAIIEGSNSITLTNTTLSGAGSKNRGVVLMQSMSGDAEGDQAVFTMTGGSLTQATGTLFQISNAAGHITLNGVSVTATSGILLTASATNGWGTSGSNGGFAWLTANGQTLAGNIVCDNISKARLILKNSSSYTGAINNANTAKLDSVAIDATSSWTLTANSYVSYIVDPNISGTSVSNITGNGYNIYYISADNSSLGGKTYSLVNGGCLLPVGGTCATGINDIASGQNIITFFPNPTTGIINLNEDFTTNNKFELSVYNSCGKIIFKGYDSKVVDLSGFSDGIYFISIKTDDLKVINKKIILIK